MSALTPPATAWQTIMAQVAPLSAAPRALDEARQAYLAEPVCADRDIPAADRSAMDGYALRSADATAAPVVLRLTGEVAAGSAACPPLAAGQCVRILTGANVPPDADTVIRIEDTRAEGDTITILKPVRPRQHILQQGENARAGDTILPAGTRLDAAAIALCAAVGAAHPVVHATPTLGLATTGSELRAAHEPVARHEIRDSNGPLLAAAAAEHGFACDGWTRIPDDRDRLETILGQSVAHHTVTLVSGGVSVGRYDFVPDVVRALGGTIHVHGVAMKPGKPLLFASFANNHVLFGLPGNPLAVLNGLHEFALPALRRLAGCPQDACRPLLRLPLAGPVSASGRRRQYRIARLVSGPEGTRVEPLPHSGSSDFVAGCRAGGMLIMPDGDHTLAAGTLVDFRPWSN